MHQSFAFGSPCIEVLREVLRCSFVVGDGDVEPLPLFITEKGDKGLIGETVDLKGYRVFGFLNRPSVNHSKIIMELIRVEDERGFI